MTLLCFEFSTFISFIYRYVMILSMHTLHFDKFHSLSLLCTLFPCPFPSHSQFLSSLMWTFFNKRIESTWLTITDINLHRITHESLGFHTESRNQNKNLKLAHPWNFLKKELCLLKLKFCIRKNVKILTDLYWNII